LDKHLLLGAPTPNNGTRSVILKAAQRFTRSQPAVPVTAKSSPFEDVIESLSARFPTFTHLEEFSIDSWNLPGEADLYPFFTSAWLTFGNHLRSLSLGGNLDGYRVLFQSKPILPSLSELSLEFTDNLTPGFIGPLTDAQILVDCVAPFINELLPRLRMLKIWSWSSEDLSNLFSLLQPAPDLQSIDILAHFDRSFSRSAQGLRELLYSCKARLRTLRLRMQPSRFGNPNSDLRLSSWFSQTVNDEPLFAKDLLFLQIYPSGSQEGFEALIMCLQRSASTLRRLIVKDRYFSEQDINTVIRAIPVGLTFLQINTYALTGVLLEAIAQRLPSLRELKLFLADHVDDQAATTVS
jgi:hypothetical protein